MWRLSIRLTGCRMLYVKTLSSAGRIVADVGNVGGDRGA